jgi:site-specific recombinase XerD
MRQRMANCKTFFSYAESEELIEYNPFRNQVSNTQDNEDGKMVISRSVIDEVIAAAPNADWKLLIALWRYTGLREMEPLELTWEDVLWEEGKCRFGPRRLDITVDGGCVKSLFAMLRRIFEQCRQKLRPLLDQ